MRIRCKDCGHEWAPRYDKEAYRQYGGDRRFRCPAEDCNNGKKDGFAFIDETADQPTPTSPVWQAELESRKDQLRHRLDKTFERLVGGNPVSFKRPNHSVDFGTNGRVTSPTWRLRTEPRRLQIAASASTRTPQASAHRDNRSFHAEW